MRYGNDIDSHSPSSQPTCRESAIQMKWNEMKLFIFHTQQQQIFMHRIQLQIVITNATPQPIVNHFQLIKRRNCIKLQVLIAEIQLTSFNCSCSFDFHSAKRAVVKSQNPKKENSWYSSRNGIKDKRKPIPLTPSSQFQLVINVR